MSTQPEPRKRTGPTTGDPEIDSHLDSLLADLPPVDAELVFETLATSLRLAQDPISRLDRKIASSALKEMRYAFSVFARYRHIRKVSIFGSARIREDDPEYTLARDFASEIVKGGWMVVTGAGPGIMQAGHEGAGLEKSFGVNIRLPFEAEPNPVIAGDPKLINFKYFFTRKLMFIKEADAFLLLPGGFGTLDETFELLTLTQTGKSDLHPIIMLDRPDGTYWQRWDRFVREVLVANGFIDKEDLSLYRVVNNIRSAVDEIEKFYRVYHSMRYVGGKLVLRLNRMPSKELLDQLTEEFSTICSGGIQSTGPSKAEIRDDDVPHLPRIMLDFDRAHLGRLRLLIDRLNELT